MAERFGIPPHTYSSDPDDLSTQNRLQVDPGESSFWDARQFFVNHEFNIAASGTQVYKFVSPVNFVIHFLAIYVDDGALKFTTHFAGTEGGTFTQIPTYPNNALSDAPIYVQQSTIYTGGTLTAPVPTAGTLVRRIRAGNNINFSTAVSGGRSQPQGLPAGTTYAILTNLSGSAAVTGVYEAVIEERPDDLEDWRDKYR